MKNTSKSSSGRKDKPLLDELPELEHEQLREALLYVEDIMERAVMNFVVLDEVAKAMYENQPLKARELDIGVLRQDLTQYGSATLEMLEPSLEFHKKTAGFNHNGVPVVMWILDNNMECFKNPDTVFYEVTTFKIPNPFKHYWKSRNLI